ncbi:MAG TPA: hypothetical protein PLV83_00970 [Bacilli bacterium]|nr:hypothetical protein [Bacilli bacterium]
MDKKGFLLVKDYNFPRIKDLTLQVTNGFSFKPRNSINYDGVVVSKLIMFNPSFTETILKKKIKKRLEIYLRFIISVIETDDDDTDITDLRAALNDLTRYKSIIHNKYLQFLDQKYSDILIKKMNLLEQELKAKIICYQPKEIEETRKR